MKKKKDRELELYVRAGAAYQLSQEVFRMLCNEMTNVLPDSDVDEMAEPMDNLEKIIFRAEEKMYRQFPELSEDYVSVFNSFGDDWLPKSEVEEKIFQLEEEMVVALWFKIWTMKRKGL